MTYDGEPKLTPFIPTPATVNVPVASPSNRFIWYVWWTDGSGNVMISYYAEDYNQVPTFNYSTWTKNWVRVAY